MKNKIAFCLIFLSVGFSSCAQERGKEQKPPTIEELFSDLDSNKDEKLSKKEVKGPIKDDFDKIDVNKDGFLTKEELKKAPKPKKQMHPEK